MIGSEPTQDHRFWSVQKISIKLLKGRVFGRSD
ncbi:hypothetical protein JMJ77_0014573 [Colletotrichum scovillei]|uniref:Uncharacterized protein n=1 Tax=Colletotrichum scovillei TaxID=1209932 RepID=A0A9P7R706_9PEZI|nr:hypothetical protein JMJ77_0014573 [Colletotrichum scovillei]KAG7066108.1 hypothetical protein JMJ78_0012845 [Colletotrichum scovillei]KAG7068710.1 hypothetical protein JMJ76_0008390 [Colletotrichum scovillei]